MPILGEPHSFDRTDIAGVPECPGVFALFVRREIVFLGAAEQSLRQSLAALFAAEAAVDADSAVTGFVVEPGNAPVDRCRELLFEHNGVVGQMPRRNGRRSEVRRAPEQARATQREAQPAPVRRPRWSDQT